MKLSCMKYEHDLVAYVDGELPPGRARRLERHVQSCGACSAVVAECRRLNALPYPAVIEPSVDFDRMFWTKLAGVRSEQKTQAGGWLSGTVSFMIRPSGLAVSAGLALGVFLVALYLLRPPHAALPQQEIMAAVDLDLYANLDVIQNSEALEIFELIEVLDELDQDGKG